MNTATRTAAPAPSRRWRRQSEKMQNMFVRGTVAALFMALGVGAFAVSAYADGVHAVDVGLMQRYFSSFAAADEELYTNTVDNVHAYEFLKGNVPLFECPDEDITRTYYFRWWTYRKHLRKTAAGWVVTEFLPPVSWAGAENTISCAMGHHLREGRWLRSGEIMDDYTRFMLDRGTVTGLVVVENK